MNNTLPMILNQVFTKVIRVNEEIHFIRKDNSGF